MLWYIKNWNNRYSPPNSAVKLNYVNPVAVGICLLSYLVLISAFILKKIFKPNTRPPTRERHVLPSRTTLLYLLNLAPLLVIIASSLFANYAIHHPHLSQYHKTIKVVGVLPSGLDIFRPISNKYNWLPLFYDTLPITLLLFMESYTVAKRMADMRGEAHLLHSCQELVALGLANVCGSLTSCFPVCGSLSRTSLNGSAGARTPLSSAVTGAIVALSLLFFTELFRYIPYPALTAIVWVAVTDLIGVSDLVESWRHSPQDFAVMTVTLLGTFLFGTEIGLGAGLVASALVLLLGYAFHHRRLPQWNSVSPSDRESRTYVSDRDEAEEWLGREGEGWNADEGREAPLLLVFRINNDVVFLTLPAIQECVASALLVADKPHEWPPLMSSDTASAPSAVVLDFRDVKIVDFSGLLWLKELSAQLDSQGRELAIVKIRPELEMKLLDYGIRWRAVGDVVGRCAQGGGDTLLMSGSSPVLGAMSLHPLVEDKSAATSHAYSPPASGGGLEGGGGDGGSTD
eukprot:gene3686-4601_t